MKRITLTADETLLARARSVAQAQGRTLNAAIREWLAEFVAGSDAQAYDALMQSLRHIDAGGHFTREECNER